MELKRILIVEDDADIAAIERDYLELGGYAVTIAPDGTTGLDAALHQPFDLILLDVMLPGIDGFAICKQVRAEKDIPILVVLPDAPPGAGVQPRGLIRTDLGLGVDGGQHYRSSPHQSPAGEN